MLVHLRTCSTTVSRRLTGHRFCSAQVAPAMINVVKSDKYVPGKMYEGFLCTSADYIPDFNMTAYCFKHDKLKTEYLHIDRNDSNNVFSVNFRTTPFDSTGLPHILEHNVLCGSQKYPVRDPFFKMLTRSVATFMNAMTGPDYTLYPFSSMNETDFQHLQKIYLDAAFRPNLNYLDFLQEGWRLEHTDLKNKESDYTIKGVVYNEMKGAFSENSSVFAESFLNKILPDHTYGYVSGGDPLEIPKLTHKNLVDFHKTYYHPSNSRIFSYGNFNLDRSLRYINEEYLSNYSAIDSSYSKIPKQARWSQPKMDSIFSRFDNMGAPFEKQNQIAIGLLTADITDNYETFVMHVLTELLVKGPNSSFYKSLIEPNISGGYSPMTGFDNHLRDTMFVVGLQDLAVEDFEKVQRIFDETIAEVIEKGFDQAHLDSVLHNMELQLKHQTPKFGLGLLFNTTPLWNHDGDIVGAMKVGKIIQQFRENIKKDEKYLQKKVEFYFKKNNHRLTLQMTPQMDYETKFTAAEIALIADKVKQLSDTDKTRIYEDGLKLAESQKKVENTNILPCLSLEDVKKAPEIYDLKESSIAGVPTQVCRVDTNGITYFKGNFNAHKLTNEQKLLLPLFTSVVDQMGTKNYDYRTFDQVVNSKTAGMNFSLHFCENNDNMDLYEIGVTLSSYALDGNASEMFDLFLEILTNVQLTDVKRFQMLLENYVSNLSVGVASSGHMYAMQSSSGLVTESGKLRSQLSGVEHIEYMKDIMSKQSAEEILKQLQEIATNLFDKNSLKCSINVTDSNSQSQLKTYQEFLEKLPQISSDVSRNKWHKSKQLDSSCLHHVMTIPVNYCAKSIVAVPYAAKDYAALKVLAKILSAKYLLPVVREQNGAYGAGAKISSDGVFSFFSYRDPNTIKTLETFDNSAQWFEDNWKTIDDQVLFEAKLGVLQQLDAPVAAGAKGSDHFSHGITQEMANEHRERVLQVTHADLEAVKNKFLKGDRVYGKCILGPENEELSKLNEKWRTFRQS